MLVIDVFGAALGSGAKIKIVNLDVKAARCCDVMILALKLENYFISFDLMPFLSAFELKQ